MSDSVFPGKEKHVMRFGHFMQHAQESSEDVSEQAEKIPDIALMFRVLYDTPTGDVSLTVTGYTTDAAARGVKCQIGHRPAGVAAGRESVPALLGHARGTFRPRRGAGTGCHCGSAGRPGRLFHSTAGPDCLVGCRVGKELVRHGMP